MNSFNLCMLKAFKSISYGYAKRILFLKPFRSFYKPGFRLRRAGGACGGDITPHELILPWARYYVYTPNHVRTCINAYTYTHVLITCTYTYPYMVYVLVCIYIRHVHTSAYVMATCINVLDVSAQKDSLVAML